MLMSLSLEWEILAAAGSDWHVQSQVMPLRPQNHKKKGLFLALKALSTRHPQLLCRELLSFFSRLSPPEVTSDATGRSWESRVGGCGHPPQGTKKLQGEEGVAALPCEAWHGQGRWGQGQQKATVPPKPQPCSWTTPP